MGPSKIYHERAKREGYRNFKRFFSSFISVPVDGCPVKQAHPNAIPPLFKPVRIVAPSRLKQIHSHGQRTRGRLRSQP